MTLPRVGLSPACQRRKRKRAQTCRHVKGAGAVNCLWLPSCVCDSLVCTCHASLGVGNQGTKAPTEISRGGKVWWLALADKAWSQPVPRFPHLSIGKNAGLLCQGCGEETTGTLRKSLLPSPRLRPMCKFSSVVFCQSGSRGAYGIADSGPVGARKQQPGLRS